MWRFSRDNIITPSCSCLACGRDVPWFISTWNRIKYPPPPPPPSWHCTCLFFDPRPQVLYRFVNYLETGQIVSKSSPASAGQSHPPLRMDSCVAARQLCDYAVGRHRRKVPIKLRGWRRRRRHANYLKNNSCCRANYTRDGTLIYGTCVYDEPRSSVAPPRFRCNMFIILCVYTSAAVYYRQNNDIYYYCCRRRRRPKCQTSLRTATFGVCITRAAAVRFRGECVKLPASISATSRTTRARIPEVKFTALPFVFHISVCVLCCTRIPRRWNLIWRWRTQSPNSPYAPSWISFGN